MKKIFLVVVSCFCCVLLLTGFVNAADLDGDNKILFKELRG